MSTLPKPSDPEYKQFRKDRNRYQTKYRNTIKAQVIIFRSKCSMILSRQLQDAGIKKVFEECSIPGCTVSEKLHLDHSDHLKPKKFITICSSHHASFGGAGNKKPIRANGKKYTWKKIYKLEKTLPGTLKPYDVTLHKKYRKDLKHFRKMMENHE